MRFAYADPPYLGKGRKFYGGTHSDAGIWDGERAHRDLILLLCKDYPDGWALSASSPSLRVILPMCPPDARIAAWVKPFCIFKKGVRPCYAWEPVIFCGGRNDKPPVPLKGAKQITPKDYLAEVITLKKGLTGAKPERFCRWVLDLLNVQPGDEVVDLFPGTGIMERVASEVAGQDGYVAAVRPPVPSVLQRHYGFTPEEELMLTGDEQ